MPVPRQVKDQRKALVAAAPTNLTVLRRSESVTALASLMTMYGAVPRRMYKDKGMYRYELENAQQCIRTYRQAVASEAARVREQQAERVPVPLEHISYAWTWRVCFPVLKPKKMKKQWDDVAAVIAGPTRTEVEKAVQILCANKKWQYQGVHGAAPHSIAYAFDRRNNESLSALQEQVIPRPEPFGLQSPPVKASGRKSSRPRDDAARQMMAA